MIGWNDFSIATMEQELTDITGLAEYTALQIAIQRVENRPSLTQYFMAIVPLILIMVGSGSILYYSYSARGNRETEKEAPLICTIIAIVMFIIEIFTIAYRHHEQYEIVRAIAEILIRINVILIIIGGSCISYIKTGGEYNTYFILVGVLTFPMYMLSFSPFLCKVYS